MWSTGRTLAVLLGAAMCTGAGGQETPPELNRPKYQFLRFNEDWSVLKDAPPEQLTDLWDPIKYVPLSKDGDIWASFGGSTRLRLESWWNFNFGSTSEADDVFVLWRALLHADVHFGENVRAFVEGKSALSSSRSLPGGRRTLDVDTLDLQQAFVDVKFPFDGDTSLVIRPGRQSFLFGKQRLVSPLPWANTLRAWDGVSSILRVGGWTVHGFWSQFAPVRKYEFNDPDSQTEFYGVYATGSLLGPELGMDFYFLGLDRDDAITVNGTTGPEERYTLGGRLFGAIPGSGFDYDFEGAYQFGEVGAGDVSAFMIGSQFGYKVADLWGSPRFHVGFDYASGDDEPGGDVETFNHLFPLGHAHLGYIDVVGRQNIIDLNLGASIKPLEKLTAQLTGHLFWRESTDDALYNAGGGVVRAGALGSDREIGQEIDVTLTYRFDRHLTGQLGYSHFFAGDFISESGPDEDIDFLYMQLQYTF